MSLLFDAPLIDGLRYQEDVISERRGSARCVDRLGTLDLVAVPLPRLARQPQDAELRLALRFRRRQLRAGRAHSRLAAAVRDSAAAVRGPAAGRFRPCPARPLRSRRGHRLAPRPRRVRGGRRHLARTRRRRCAFASGRDAGFRRANLELAPRSAYLLSGEARHDWEHSIAPGERLRFSITFRTLVGQRPAHRALPARDGTARARGTVLRPCAGRCCCRCCCSPAAPKGRRPTCRAISEARSLAAEWALVNEQARERQAHRDLCRHHARGVREQLQTDRNRR